MHTTRISPPRSLAAIRSGDRFRVDRILFDRLRGLCARLGLDQGVGAACVSDAGPRLILELDGGRRIAFERDWARFVTVELVESAYAESAEPGAYSRR